MLMGIVRGGLRGGLRGGEGKMPIRDESLKNPNPIISGFEEESPTNGMVILVLVVRSVM